MNEPRTMSLDAVFAIAANGYLYELEMLVQIVHADYFMKLLPAMVDYRRFLTHGRRKLFGANPLDVLCDKDGVINGASEHPMTREFFACANMAACCYQFSGWTIPIGSLEQSHVHQYCQFAISKIDGDKAQKAYLMQQKLNDGDTGRVIQSLKLLGVIDADSTRCKQLSLGASKGIRDRHATHQIPFIKPAVPGNFHIAATTKLSELPPLRFGVHPATVDDIILVDINPALQDYYQRLNATESERVLALNQDTYDALEDISGRVSKRRVQPRDLVILFRLEPVMLPDVDRFLDALGEVICETADLIVSIGAGDELEGFKHRLEKMNEIATGLSARAMKPLRIKWCRGDTAEQQRNSPLFGLGAYASFEILYCKLRRNRLRDGRKS